MNAITALRGPELERLFADWGETVVLRRVQQTFSPATGNLVESHQDVVVTAVVKEQTDDPTRDTAMRHATRQVEFVFRTEELPEGIQKSTVRVIHRSREFSLATWRVSADGAVTTALGQSV